LRACFWSFEALVTEPRVYYEESDTTEEHQKRLSIRFSLMPTQFHRQMVFYASICA
jgi:hypothetical protein